MRLDVERVPMDGLSDVGARLHPLLSCAAVHLRAKLFGGPDPDSGRLRSHARVVTPDARGVIRIAHRAQIDLDRRIPCPSTHCSTSRS